MKIEILQEELVKALGLASRAVSSRPQLAVLGNILIEAKKEGLVLSATDLELGISLTVNAKVTEEGVVTVPAKTLHEFCASLNPGKVELTMEKEALRVKAGSFSGKFQTISADEFPRLPEGGGEKTIKMQFGEFAKAAQMVLFAAARDSLRPVLTGILLEAGKSQLKAVATDGFRLAIKKIKAEGREGEAITLLVPMRAVAEVARLEGEGELTITHAEKTNQVIFQSGTVRVVTQIIEGNYPDYNKIIPQEFAANATIAREELLQAVKAIHILARENSNMMKWILKEGTLVIKAESPERGEAEVGVPMSLDGEEGEVVFNAKFIIDILNVSTAETINFGMGGKLAPCTFQEQGNSEMLHVVMPINA